MKDIFVEKMTQQHNVENFHAWSFEVEDGSFFSVVSIGSDDAWDNLAKTTRVSTFVPVSRSPTPDGSDSSDERFFQASLSWPRNDLEDGPDEDTSDSSHSSDGASTVATVATAAVTAYAAMIVATGTVTPPAQIRPVSLGQNPPPLLPSQLPPPLRITRKTRNTPK